MQNKKVVYLDQNFVSNLAKALYLSGWKDSLASFYLELHNLLSDLTDCDKLICPTSPFHREEMELGNRVKEFLWHFVEQMGYGLSFKHSAEIKNSQLFSAAQAYCGLPVTQHSEWEVAFNRDPQIPIRQLSMPELLVNIPNPQEFNGYLRLSKTSIADEYWNYKKNCKGKRKKYTDELEVQKKELILEIFKPRLGFSIKPSKTEQLVNLLGLAGIIDINNSVNKILQHSINPEGFFASSQLSNCPFIHIWSSLMAADILYYSEMKPTPSLFIDFEIVASVLPYTDILCVDAHVSELIGRADLSNRFNTRIFTVHQRDTLVTMLRSL